MRAKMPRCAAFVDALREAFGADEINSVIKRGLRPECEAPHRVRFSEGPHVIGSSVPEEPNAISGADMVVGSVLHLPRGRKSA